MRRLEQAGVAALLAVVAAVAAATLPPALDAQLSKLPPPLQQQLRARQAEIEGSMRHLARAGAGTPPPEPTPAETPEADPAASATEPAGGAGGVPPTFASVLVGQRLEPNWGASGPHPNWMM